jgi:hypothetical protein
MPAESWPARSPEAPQPQVHLPGERWAVLPYLPYPGTPEPSTSFPSEPRTYQ